MEGAPHRGEVGEPNEGDVHLLDDLSVDVGGCGVRERTCFRAVVSVTTLTRAALTRDHVHSVILCGVSDWGCSGQRYCNSHVCWHLSWLNTRSESKRSEGCYYGNGLWASEMSSSTVDLDLPRCSKSSRMLALPNRFLPPSVSFHPPPSPPP